MVALVFSASFLATKSPNPEVSKSAHRVIKHGLPSLTKKIASTVTVYYYGSKFHEEYQKTEDPSKTQAEVSTQVANKMIESEIVDLSIISDDLYIIFNGLYEWFIDSFMRLAHEGAIK